MSSHATSDGSWSVAGNYQPEYRSFTFESEESYHLQISLHQADPSRRSTADDAQPCTVTTGGEGDGFHCTHSWGEEHCILHSGSDTGLTSSLAADTGEGLPETKSAQEPSGTAAPGYDQSSSSSLAVERYLHDHQRHERVAVDHSNLTRDTTEQGRGSPLPGSRSRLSSSGEDTHGSNKEESHKLQDTETNPGHGRSSFRL